jgi:hypothetical protein
MIKFLPMSLAANRDGSRSGRVKITTTRFLVLYQFGGASVRASRENCLAHIGSRGRPPRRKFKMTQPRFFVFLEIFFEHFSGECFPISITRTVT